MTTHSGYEVRTLLPVWQGDRLLQSQKYLTSDLVVALHQLQDLKSNRTDSLRVPLSCTFFHRQTALLTSRPCFIEGLASAKRDS